MYQIKRPTQILLILSNLPVLIGLLLYGWGIKEVILIYWLETIVIGLFSIAKTLIARASPDIVTRLLKNGFGYMLWPYKLLITFLTAVVVGVYTLVTGLAVTFMMLVIDYGFHDLPEGITPPEYLYSQMSTGYIWVALGIICLQHTLSFVVNFIMKKEYTTNQDSRQMEILTRRIGTILNPVLPCMILFAIIVSLEGRLSPDMADTIRKIPAVLMILSKTIFDFRSHTKEHDPDIVQS